MGGREAEGERREVSLPGKRRVTYFYNTLSWACLLDTIQKLPTVRRGFFLLFNFSEKRDFVIRVHTHRFRFLDLKGG